jgi:low affinity Fe/Cu permease
MNHAMLVFAGVAAVVVVGYLLVMRVFYVEGKELDKKIDPSKLKAWKDDEN